MNQQKTWAIPPTTGFLHRQRRVHAPGTWCASPETGTSSTTYTRFSYSSQKPNDLFDPQQFSERKLVVRNPQQVQQLSKFTFGVHPLKSNVTYRLSSEHSNGTASSCRGSNSRLLSSASSLESTATIYSAIDQAGHELELSNRRVNGSASFLMHNDASSSSSSRKHQNASTLSCTPPVVSQNMTLDELCVFRTRICPRKAEDDSCTLEECCPFSHCLSWHRRNPRITGYRPTLCPNVVFTIGANKKMRVRNHCRRGRLCLHSHTKEEQMYHPLVYKTQLCRDWPSCNKHFCPFAHGMEELRSPQDTNFPLAQGPEKPEVAMEAHRAALAVGSAENGHSDFVETQAATSPPYDLGTDCINLFPNGFATATRSSSVRSSLETATTTTETSRITPQKKQYATPTTRLPADLLTTSSNWKADDTSSVSTGHSEASLLITPTSGGNGGPSVEVQPVPSLLPGSNDLLLTTTENDDDNNDHHEAVGNHPNSRLFPKLLPSCEPCYSNPTKTWPTDGAKEDTQFLKHSEFVGTQSAAQADPEDHLASELLDLVAAGVAWMLSAPAQQQVQDSTPATGYRNWYNLAENLVGSSSSFFPSQLNSQHHPNASPQCIPHTTSVPSLEDWRAGDALDRILLEYDPLTTVSRETSMLEEQCRAIDEEAWISNSVPPSVYVPLCNSMLWKKAAQSPVTTGSTALESLQNQLCTPDQSTSHWIDHYSESLPSTYPDHLFKSLSSSTSSPWDPILPDHSTHRTYFERKTTSSINACRLPILAGQHQYPSAPELTGITSFAATPPYEASGSTCITTDPLGSDDRMPHSLYKSLSP